jgi:hypothetical protein
MTENKSDAGTNELGNISIVEAGHANPKVALCPNCQTPIDGPYCSSCGQSQKNLNKQIWTLTGELVDDFFRPDSRAARTLFALFFRPGFLTTEYFAGRRARYSPPLRLYLIISFLFFFTVPQVSDIQIVGAESEEVATTGQEELTVEDEINIEITGIKLSWLTDEENEQLRARLKQQVLAIVKRAKEEPSEVWGEVMDQMSVVMFFMLPVFAVFLKVAYLGSGVYYAEHLLLALHNHSFLFLAALLSAGLETLEATTVGLVAGPLASLVSFWIPIYMYLSLKNTYAQSFGLSAFKFILLAMIYTVLALLGLGIAFFAEVLSQ